MATIEMVQRMAEDRGGIRERGAVAQIGFIDGEATNIASAFDGNGAAMFNFAWRPWQREHDEHNGLFLC